MSNKLTEPQERLLAEVRAQPPRWACAVGGRYRRAVAMKLIAKGLLVEVNPHRHPDDSLMVKLPDGK